MLSFKPAFSLSSFTFIKRFFSYYSLSAIRVVLSVYLWLLVFLLAILIPAYDSSRLGFNMIYSACKLNKQSDNIQPCHTPFPTFNQFVVPRKVLTIASWPAYKFLRRQVTDVWYWLSDISISKCFPQFVVIHTVKGFIIVNEADGCVFLEFLCLLMIQQMLAIWSLVPLPFLNPACTCGSSQFMYCLSLAWRILSMTLLACKMSTTVW